ARGSHGEVGAAGRAVPRGPGEDGRLEVGTRFALKGCLPAVSEGSRMSGLSEKERERYTRQLVLPSWGEEAQLRLKASTVFVAGAGGLGSAAALYLAAAGIGCISVCDRDRVELSRLNREVRVVPLVAEMTGENVGRLAADADILLDCLDNVPARLVLNRHSVS